MPLDVYVQPLLVAPSDGGEYEYVCSLDDDGYYWFLHPQFEHLAQETGRYIDLYDTVRFSGAELEPLIRTLTAARHVVEAKPERWEVTTGVRPGPTPQELRATVWKSQMCELLEKLAAAAQRAQSTDQHLLFVGD